jgi:Xaa-Pro aminopeptidase
MTSRTEALLIIPPLEFRKRQDRVRDVVAAQDLAGAIIWSRGGGSIDMAADVLYLTNHYSQQPYMGDVPGLWSGRSHAALIVPVGAPSVLCVDFDWWRRDLVVADDVRASTDVPQALATALHDLGLAQERLALVGANCMTASTYVRFYECAPKARLERDDSLVERLRAIKSPGEIAVIRRAADIGSQAVEHALSAAVEGATEAEAVASCAALLAREGAVLWDAPCASGPSSHVFSYARLPSYDAVRALSRGDLFHVDCYGAWGGYCFDVARTRIVGDELRDDQRTLLEATVVGVETICDAMRPGMTGGELHSLARAALASTRYARRLASQFAMPRLVGHGLGLQFEPPWLVAGSDDRIEAGMHVSVEVMLGSEGIGGAMHEEQGLVRDGGFEVISSARTRWW